MYFITTDMALNVQQICIYLKIMTGMVSILQL